MSEKTKRDYEKTGMKVSIAGSLLMSVSAIIMALVSHSQAILLDGLYTFVTLIMAMLSLRVIDLLKSPETKSRPFGYMAFEPFFNLLKSLVMISLLTFFLIINIQALIAGGRHMELNMSVIYIFICLIIYALIILLLKKCGRMTSSTILELEIRNWKIDALLTVGIAVSLIVAIILVRLGANKILPYIDPAIVIILILISIPVPLKVFFTEFKRLLLISPENNTEEFVKTRLSSIIEKNGMLNVQVWGLKSGRCQYIILYTDLERDYVSLAQLDEIRSEVFMELKSVYPKFYADIIFTKNIY